LVTRRHWLALVLDVYFCITGFILSSLNCLVICACSYGAKNLGIQGIGSDRFFYIDSPKIKVKNTLAKPSFIRALCAHHAIFDDGLLFDARKNELETEAILISFPLRFHCHWG
jgi:hypothetical protein